MDDHLPRLTGDQIRQLLAAEETGTYPNCFTCGQAVTTLRATLHYGMEEERRVVTMFPCGHRMSYNVRVAEQMQAQAATKATELADLDTTKVYLVPVEHLGVVNEPELVHLAMYAWQERIDLWATYPAICGRSTEQGPLPEGTEVTCPECLKRKDRYEQIIYSANHAEELEAEARRQQALAGDTPENGAWHTVWLESGKWRWTTSRMTTEQREYAADRVAAYSKYLAAEDGELEREEPSDLRWWRDDL